MPRVRPFTGLLYDPAAGSLDSVTAPPYDVISPMDRDRLYAASDYNVVRLILGRDEPGDDGSANKYTRAAASLRAWRGQGILRPTPEPCGYPYELTFHWAGRQQRVRGLIAEVDLEPWGGSIVPHERTMPGPMEDRLSLIRACRANLSAVYVVSPDPVPGLSGFLDDATAGAPGRETSDEAGTTHRVWAHPLPASVQASLAGGQVMIADGHHRYTVALAYRQEMRDRHGPGPWDAMMMFIVDAGTEDPPVLPIHRTIAPDPSTSPTPPPPEPPAPGRDAIRVRDLAEILATVHDDDMTVGVVSRDDGEIVHRIATLSGTPPAVFALHERVLDHLDPSRLAFVPDAAAAERAVATGEAVAAYLLPPTRVDRVWSVVRSQRRLPQKSTYFWPKPRTGMVMRPMD
jgi:uncharacterized protein (DUF1015 family)